MSLSEPATTASGVDPQVQVYRYSKPQFTGRPKKNTWLVRRPAMFVVVQCVREGGENNLHYHTKSETTWFVLKGRARFEGVGGKVLAELGPMEGIHLPGGSRYRFATIGGEDLEILQIVGVENDGEGESERINLEPHREWMTGDAHLTKY